MAGIACLAVYPVLAAVTLLSQLAASGNCAPDAPTCGPSDAPVLAMLISLVAAALAFFATTALRAPRARTWAMGVGGAAAVLALLFFGIGMTPAPS